MSHYNNPSKASLPIHSNPNQINSFEKSVITNSKQSIEKHLSHLKIDQNQLNYALFLSIEHFKLEEHTDQCVLILLRHKANPNCQINKQTPFTIACRKGQQFLVKLLLQYGAKPDLCNKNGEHPLLIVLKDKRQNYDVAQLLINAMSTVNIELAGSYPIVLSVQREYLKIFQMLIEKGANLIFDSENILHIIVKQKFKKVERKKKFIKELSGRFALMQQDAHHKMPTDYEENQEIKQFILENFKPKALKDQGKQLNSSKFSKQKQKEGKENKPKDVQVGKDKKKVVSKDLDISFSEVDQEEQQQYKPELIQVQKQKQTKRNVGLVQIPEEEQKANEKLQEQVIEGGQVGNQKWQAGNGLTSEQRDKGKKKQKQKFIANLKIQAKKKGNNELINRKKKQKLKQEIVPRAVLKRKNSSVQQQTIKGDKHKMSSLIKKQAVSKKQSFEVNEKEKSETKSLHQQEKVEAKKDDYRNQLQRNRLKQLEDSCEQIRIDCFDKIDKESQTDSEESFQGSLQKLNQQIFQLVRAINAKNQNSIFIIHEILKILEHALGECAKQYRQDTRISLYIYGSQATGLAIQDSDIDFLVDTDIEATIFMKLLQSNRSLDIQEIQEVKFITSATVPVIKLKMSEKYDSMHVDITFQNRTHMGLKCLQMIKSFMQAEPLLRPLVLIIKTLMKVYDLSDPYKGGLSSYGVTLMVIALLQFTQRQKKQPNNIGELLLSFFYFYGEQIDYISQAIIIHDIGLFGSQPVYCIYRLPYFTDLNPKLIIYDPLNPVNNVGRTTYRISSIKKLFSICYLRLRQQEQYQLKSILDGAFKELLTDF